jgi:TetR/AcrR family transcriptional regulator, tetracycline repressor protein
MIKWLVNGTPKMKLAPGQIVDTALILLNEVGIDELTTRRLAERLGVQQPALYWHFRNKQALIDAINAAMLERGHTRRMPLPDEAWDDFLKENGRSFRRALLAYRDGARVHAGTEPSAADLPGAEAQLRCLVDAGFPPSLAMHALIAIGNFVMGCVLEQQAANARPQDDTTLAGRLGAYPLLASAIGREPTGPCHDQTFETGLALIIEGLRVRLYQASMAAISHGTAPNEPASKA